MFAPNANRSYSSQVTSCRPIQNPPTVTAWRGPFVGLPAGLGGRAAHLERPAGNVGHLERHVRGRNLFDVGRRRDGRDLRRRTGRTRGVLDGREGQQDGNQQSGQTQARDLRP